MLDAEKRPARLAALEGNEEFLSLASDPSWLMR
jgi:hypothetical protein